MRIVFCSEPFFPLRVDAAYESEAEAARDSGFDFDLVDFEALVDAENPLAAIRKIREQPAPVTAVYRGWMLKPEKYALLYQALANRHINLINSPAQYKHCHYLPESYSLIENCTPKTISIKPDSDFNFDDVFRRLSVFGNKPLILKDYVKSRKHEWHEACFIPSASDRTAVERVVNRFLELQGEDLNEGLVFREFVEFQPLAAHSKSKMPLTKEFRLFFLDGELLDYFEYWDEGDYSGNRPPENIFADVAGSIQSRFFTMDIAQTVSGEWQIVELGDGQVTGLPDNADMRRFYQALKNREAQITGSATNH
jgi:hypothetical protein